MLIKTVSFFVSLGWQQWSLPTFLEFGATRVLLFVKDRCTEPPNVNSAQIPGVLYTPECGFWTHCALPKLLKMFCLTNRVQKDSVSFLVC